MKKTLFGVLIVVLTAGLMLPVTIAAADPDLETNVDTKTISSSDTDYNNGGVVSTKNLSAKDLDTASSVWTCPYYNQTFPKPSESKLNESYPPEFETPESELPETKPPRLPESEPTLPFEVLAPDQVNKGANLYVKGKIYLPVPDTFGGSFLNYRLVFELEGQGRYGNGFVYWNPPYAGEVRFRIKIGTEDIPPGTYRLISHLSYAVRFLEEDNDYIVWHNLDTGLTVTINPGLQDGGYGDGFINHLISLLKRM